MKLDTERMNISVIRPNKGYTLVYKDKNKGVGYIESIPWKDIKSAILTNLHNGLPKYIVSCSDDLVMKVIPVANSDYPYKLEPYYGELT